jgi:hypothetical protein
MWGLKLAMRKIRRELKTSPNVIWLFLRNTAALQLNRYTE